MLGRQNHSTKRTLLLRVHAIAFSNNDELDKEIFLQAEGYLAPSHAGHPLALMLSSIIPTIPSVDLATVSISGGERKPHSDT